MFVRLLPSDDALFNGLPGSIFWASRVMIIFGCCLMLSIMCFHLIWLGLISASPWSYLPYSDAPGGGQVCNQSDA